MASENDTVDRGSSATQLLSPGEPPPKNDGKSPGKAALNIGMEFASLATNSEESGNAPLVVGLIDCYRFSRECLMTALEGLHTDLGICPFTSVNDCITKNQNGLDLVIYYPHGNDASELAIERNVGAIREAVHGVPIVVLSDVEDENQPKTIRSTLSSGAHGFIPTRTTGILIAIAAIRFVKAGGTFAPLDQLLTNRPNRGSAQELVAQQLSLTTRQIAVLSHLQQGKANKIIAHELRMSESTVKVHVRNIMRKMGATNRTQAAYRATQLWNGAKFARVSD